ncbi:MAG: Na(+)/H(+) antiporter subunit [Actinomycetota bacterium]|jgi:multicomponent Na+:H+ antiporter subunit C
MSIAVALVTAVLFGTGSWLLMQRRLTRIIIGIGLLGHGANLLLVSSGGPSGDAPIISGDVVGSYSDPLPQALALTAIVITFGVTALLLALGYRSWQITRDDVVEDDVEDRRVLRRSNQDGPESDADLEDAVPVGPDENGIDRANEGRGGSSGS